MSAFHKEVTLKMLLVCSGYKDQNCLFLLSNFPGIFFFYQILWQFL